MFLADHVRLIFTKVECMETLIQVVMIPALSGICHINHMDQWVVLDSQSKGNKFKSHWRLLSVDVKFSLSLSLQCKYC